MHIESGRWIIDVDPQVTAEAYLAQPLGCDCDCSDCRNFAAATNVAFPPEFCSLAERLGVDVRKPIELAHYGREPSGLHYTDGWFHVVGRIVSGADAMKPIGPEAWTTDLEEMPSGFGFGFTNHVALVAEPFKAHHIIQLEFQTRVPWVIDDPESQ